MMSLSILVSHGFGNVYVSLDSHRSTFRKLQDHCHQCTFILNDKYILYIIHVPCMHADDNIYICLMKPFADTFRIIESQRILNPLNKVDVFALLLSAYCQQGH